MIKGLYRGYSSYQYQKQKTFAIADVELVKLDLLNHLFTRKGERIMMPTFGTRIPDLPFEQLDEITLSIIEQDIRSVVQFDPRVQLLSLSITPQPDQNFVTAKLDLFYIELNLTGNLDIHIFVGSQ